MKLFGNVLMDRCTGVLLPLSMMNKVSVSNMAINALKLDNGVMDIRKDINGNVIVTPITENPYNLPSVPPSEKWGNQTELYGNFNGTLEAGVVTLFDSEIESLIIRRASSRTNFTSWEDVYELHDVQNRITADISFTFVDKNIESGVIYSYAVQPVGGLGTKRGSLYKIGMSTQVFESTFLVGYGGQQLKLAFNAEVSSVKRNIREARIETIGAKYPYITKNSVISYREYAISGLITHFMDERKDFIPRADLFIDEEMRGTVDLTQEYQAVYDTYQLNDFNNTVLEREFREKVDAFLSDGRPKLLKSPTEGNIIVRLMDISFAPIQSLGRMIYTFNATAIEVDDYTVDNLDKYNIQSI